MAALSTGELAGITADLMRDEVTGWGAVKKADLRAAVDALDTYLDANAAAINLAIPQPARAQLTTAQKARLMRYVINRRYG